MCAIIRHEIIVGRLAEQILKHARRLPEGAPVAAKGFLHLGNRPAVDQALSRLARRGQLIRAGRGVYLRPVEGRFGARPPSVEQVVEAIAPSEVRSSRRTGRLRRMRSGRRKKCRCAPSILRLGGAGR
jgi:hypothetical protein